MVKHRFAQALPPPSCRVNTISSTNVQQVIDPMLFVRHIIAHAFCTPYYRPAGAILRSKTENELFHTRVIPIIALGLSLGMYKLDEDESSNLSRTNLDDAVLIQG